MQASQQEWKTFRCTVAVARSDRQDEALDGGILEFQRGQHFGAFVRRDRVGNKMPVWMFSNKKRLQLCGEQLPRQSVELVVGCFHWLV